MIKTRNRRFWLWFGVLAGIGMENKYSMALFGFVIVAGLLLTKERKLLAGKWIWLGGLIAFLIFLPNLIWNIRHDRPFLELMRNIRASGRDIGFTPLGYIRAQIFLMSPATFPVWLLGGLYFFFWRDGRAFRALGWAFAGVLSLLIILHGKDYYASPVFPMVLAGGAIVIERFCSRRRRVWLQALVVLLILLPSLALLPLVVPVLTSEGFLRYQSALPFKIQPDEKSMLTEPMPHYYSFCFGWKDLVRGVTKAYNSIPASERADTAVFANNFAEAGAIDLIGPKYGLPKAISGHQSYWLWGPRGYSGRTMIVVGDTPEGARRWFHEVTVIAELQNPYAPPYENKPILLCRGPKGFRTLAEVWPQLKTWD
jgi:hypothetical protein